MTYNRPKSAVVNDTPIRVLSQVKASDKTAYPAALVDDADAPSVTGIVDQQIQVDVDESGGESLKTLGTLVTSVLVAADGTTTLKVTFTPYMGNGDAGNPQEFIFNHPQSMDVFQSAAGRARQA